MPNDRELVALILLIGVSTFGIGNSHGSSSTDECNISLDLTGLGLTNLDHKFIENEFLTRLILDENSISRVSSVAFSSLPRLSYLSIASNNLSDLNLRPFSELPNLETLILNENCKMRTISERWYDDDLFANVDFPSPYYERKLFCTLQFDSDLVTLRHLFLENNNIQELTFISGKLPALTHLHLSHNPLEINQEFISDLHERAPALTHLYLRDCGLSKFDASRLPTLTSLYLDSNNIDSICNEDCSYGSLKLEVARSLETLSVSQNLIFYLDSDSFQHTTNLTMLDLSHNALWEIRNGTFDKLHQLRTLSLESNNRAKISAVHTFKGLINLENLFLGGIDLSLINAGLFENLSSLKKLTLNSTRIRSIDSRTFSKLTRLEVLSLADNRLSVIPHESMPISGSLIHLDLDNNKFSNMENISLANTPNMLSLSLRDNPLTTMSARWLSNAPPNLVINLGYTCSDPEPDEVSSFSPDDESATIYFDETTESY